MSSLEFAFQSSVEETAIGCLGNLNILLSRTQFAYNTGALGATHGVFSPPLNLEILPRMGVVRIEHGDTSTTGRVYEFTAARNHRHSPGIRTAEEKHLDPSVRSQERARLDSSRHNLPAQWPGSAGQDRSSRQCSADGLGRENTRSARLEPTGPVRSRLRTA